MQFDELQQKAGNLKLDILKAIAKANSGWTGAAISSLDILVAIYYAQIEGKNIMRFDVKKPGSSEQDYFLLSKAEAAISQYAILADLGFYPKNELNNYRQIDSLLQALPSRKVPGVAASVGSIGDAFSVAVGLAMCLKMEKAKNKVFTLLADYELQDGLVWEAALAANHHKCDNLIAVVDNSALQPDGYLRGIMNVQAIQDKFEAFGWKLIHVLDGHNYEELLKAFKKALKVDRQPVCIWAHTVSAKGIVFAEGKPGYFAKPLSEAELEEVLKSFD